MYHNQINHSSPIVFVGYRIASSTDITAFLLEIFKAIKAFVMRTRNVRFHIETKRGFDYVARPRTVAPNIEVIN